MKLHFGVRMIVINSTKLEPTLTTHLHNCVSVTNSVKHSLSPIKSLEFMKARELNMRETRTFNSRSMKPLWFFFWLCNFRRLIPMFCRTKNGFKSVFLFSSSHFWQLEFNRIQLENKLCTLCGFNFEKIGILYSLQLQNICMLFEEIYWIFL